MGAAVAHLKYENIQEIKMPTKDFYYHSERLA